MATETRKKTGGAIKKSRQSRAMTAPATEVQASAMRAAVQAAEVTAKSEKKKAERLEAENQQVCDLVARYSDKLFETASVGARVQKDVIASFGAVGTTELINYFMRWFAEMSKEAAGDKGFWYRNVAYTQTLPGMIGLVYYVVDTLLQSSKEEMTERARAQNKAIMPFVPGPWRLTFNQMANSLSTIGLATFARAVRYSLAESVDEQLEKDQVISDQKSALEASLEREKEARRLLEAARKEAQELAARLKATPGAR